MSTSDIINYSADNGNIDIVEFDDASSTVKVSIVTSMISEGQVTVPGGKTGQVYTKLSDEDFDVGWVDNLADGVGITEIIGGDAEITPSETITPITIKTSDNKETQVDIIAKNGMTNVVAYTKVVEASDWQSSTEYAEYGYNFFATVAISTDKLDYGYDTYVPTVTPTDISDILEGNLAPFAVSGASTDSGTLGVYVYAKEQPTTAKTFNVVLAHVIE